MKARSTMQCARKKHCKWNWPHAPLWWRKAMSCTKPQGGSKTQNSGSGYLARRRLLSISPGDFNNFQQPRHNHSVIENTQAQSQDIPRIVWSLRKSSRSRFSVFLSAASHRGSIFEVPAEPQPLEPKKACRCYNFQASESKKAAPFISPFVSTRPFPLQ